MGSVASLRSALSRRFDVAFDFARLDDVVRVGTGVPGVDRLLGGGIAKGTLTEVFGEASTGKTSLLFALLAGATGGGECCAWVDVAGTFDPLSASEAGVDLGRVLWVNCAGNAEHGLQAADLLTQAGGFGVVVLDLADTPEREAKRISLASWFRLRHAAERQGTALVVAGARVTAPSCSSAQVRMHRKRPVWVGKLLNGILAEAESRKHYRSQVAEFMAVR